MPYITCDDGVKLYYEEAGSGTPLIFVHEYAGDWRAWEPQMRFFARKHRCIFTHTSVSFPTSSMLRGPMSFEPPPGTDTTTAAADDGRLDVAAPEPSVFDSCGSTNNSSIPVNSNTRRIDFGNDTRFIDCGDAFAHTIKMAMTTDPASSSCSRSTETGSARPFRSRDPSAHN